MDRENILSTKPTVEISENDNVFEISIMSDTHLIPEEMIAYNEEFVKAYNSDRKFFAGSEGIFKSAIQIIQRKNSDIILIPGDLTKDGEKKSHQLVARYLEEWASDKEGRRVFLVPGNHDINNNDARDFNYKGTGETVKADMTSPKDFIEIYGDLIYNREDVKCYKDSEYFKEYLDKINKAYPHRAEDERYNYYAQGYGSYVSRIEAQDCTDKEKTGLTIFALDSTVNSIEFSSDGLDGHKETYGVFTESLFRWILDEKKKAKERKDACIVISHHPIVPSFEQEDYVLSPYILRNWDQRFASDNKEIDGKYPGQILVENNISYYFTGHLHANDISVQDFDNKKLYCIQTGSIVTHPMPIRHVLIHNYLDMDIPSVKVEIETEQIGKFTYTDPKTQEERLIDDAYEFLSREIFTADLIANYFEEDLEKIVDKGISLKAFAGPYLREGFGDNFVSLVNERLLDDPYKLEFANGAAEVVFTSGQVENTDIYGPGEKISIDLSAVGFINEPLMVRGEKIEETVNNIITQVENKIITPENLYNWLYSFMKALLNAQIYHSEEYGVKTVGKVINEAFTSFLRGSTMQKPWVTEIIERYSQEGNNLVKDAFMTDTVMEVTNEIFRDISSQIDYKLNPGDEKYKDSTKDFIANILESDSRRNGIVYRALIKTFADMTGDSLYESLRSERIINLLGLDTDEIKFSDIVSLIFSSDAYQRKEDVIVDIEQDIEKTLVEWITGVKNKNINDVLISMIDSMTQESFEFQYKENKNTIIIEMMV